MRISPPLFPFPLIFKSFTRRPVDGDVEVNLIDIAIHDLPEEFEGFTIAHATDIHCSKFVTGDYIEGCVDLINRQRPDLVVLTGDFLTGRIANLSPCIEALKGLRKPSGAFAVLGNHDHWADWKGVVRGLEGAGVETLINERRRIERGRASLSIIGADDPITGRMDLETALGNGSRDGVQLLLVHSPGGFHEASHKGMDLVMAGHTHGGQVNLPIVRGMMKFRLFYGSYLAGLFKRGRTHLYVNRGIGSIYGIRIDCKPEIAIYRLRRSVPGEKDKGGDSRS